MLLPIKAICDRKKMRRDGTSLIFIQYCYCSSNRILLNTEIAIPPQFWNKKRKCINADLPPEYGSPGLYNQELTRQFRLIEDLVSLATNKGIEDKGRFVKETFDPKADISQIAQNEGKIQFHRSAARITSANNLYGQIDDYILSKEKKVSKATVTVFRNMKKHLMAYEAFTQNTLSFQSFNYNFYESFVDFLTFDYIQQRRKETIVGLKVNSIGKTIKQFRIFIKDRMRRKIIEPIDLTDFKIPEEESDAIYLTYDEIGKIYHTDVTAFPHLKQYRDMFVLACLTGLRFSDFSTLNPEDLRRDMLYKKQGKSDHWVVIPMRKEAKKIFTEQFKDNIPSLTNPEFNRHIKTIGKLAGIKQLMRFSHKQGNKDVEVIKPKYEWITSHSARRSFCTNEFLAGTPVKLIMKISGHKNEKDFYRYIRVSPEEAAQKIKALWEERDCNLEVFA